MAVTMASLAFNMLLIDPNFNVPMMVLGSPILAA
jgi:hypothetical protein